MFARSALRAAAPLRQSIRTYASHGTGPSSGISPGVKYTGYAVGGLAAAFGAVYFIPGPGPNDKLVGKGPQSKSDATAPSKKAFVGGEQGFISLKLKESEDLSSNTKRLTFEFPESDQVSGLTIASAVVTKFQAEGAEKPTIRPYTPTSDEDRKGTMDFVIKKYPNGPMSEHIHNLKPGDTLDIKGPITKYPMEHNKHNHIAMIAGGTGITPMYQVMRYIFQNPEDQTKVSLIFGNVGEDDILLRKELNELENTYPRRFKAFYTLDNPPESWTQGKGFITKDLLKEVLPEPKEENIKIFVCGPPGLYKAISGAKKSPQDQGELEGHLKDLGYSKDQVFKF